jgi:predicted  nucleic acid-binding Zn-ribbon protein
MITDTDIKKLRDELRKDFATKKELKGEIDRANEYTDKLFLNLYEAIKTLSNELTEFKNEMKEFKEQTNKNLDWLVGAFKKFDEEHTILSARYSSINKTIDNHENRITSLEKNN